MAGGRIWAAVGLALAALAVLVGSVLTYRIVASGALVPGQDATVYEVELFHRLTFYVGEESRHWTDALGGVLLAATAGVAFLAYALLRRAGRSADGRARAAFLIGALGLGYLALDEVAGLHETIGYNAPSLAELPGIERPEHAVYYAYALPAALYLAVFRDVLFSRGAVSALFGTAAGFFCLAAAFDTVGAAAKGLAEPVAAAALLAAFVLLALDELGAVSARRRRDSVPLAVGREA